MDSSDRQRAALPPIKLLDVDKIKREEAEYQSRNSHMSSSAMSSPTGPYPSGPPPPYSHPSFGGARTPPECRRMSGEDQAKPKQSLPSIHEALGVEQSISYSSQTPYSSAPQSTYQAQAPPSPPPARRSFAMEPPPPPPNAAPLSHDARSPYSQRRDISPRQAQESADRQRALYAAQPPPPPPSQPPQSVHTAQSPLHYPRSYPATAHSPTLERTSSHPVSMPPTSSTFAYGYAPYPSHYASFPAQPPPASATSSIYQPSVTQPAPSRAEPAWRSDRHPQPFGESVKRHLDMWDFGEALNEVAESSGYCLEFSRQYGNRLHQTQRTEPVPAALPQVAEIEQLMEKSRRQLESFAKMREFVIAQQTAYLQQVQEQQYRAQDGAKRDSVHHVEDTKGGGFAGPDAKKRRGRAAPPGRCHSCNRAETPEWRRGPDGARTLCNACGLHYAKLTRKAGKNAAAIGSSNLRPKASEDTQG